MTYILDTVYFIRLDQVYYVFLSLDLVHNGHILMSAPVLRIQDVYPGSQILMFTHPGLFVNYFSFDELKKQIWDPGSGIGCLLTPGSGIGLFRIPDLRSRIPNSYF